MHLRILIGTTLALVLCLFGAWHQPCWISGVACGMWFALWLHSVVAWVMHDDENGVYA